MYFLMESISLFSLRTMNHGTVSCDVFMNFSPGENHIVSSGPIYRYEFLVSISLRKNAGVFSIAGVFFRGV
jgi:hypothetical protein